MITRTPIQWLPVKNSTDEIIPAGALLRVTGIDTDTGAFTVDKPDTDDGRGLLVGGLCLIPPQGMGQAHLEPFAIVAYDATDGEPAVGELWGVKAGSWLARKDYQEFQITGGAGQGLVNASRYGSGGSSSTTESPGSALCSSRGWWAGVRTDTNLSFLATATAAAGACACVDTAFSAQLDHAASQVYWHNTTDLLSICGVDYRVVLYPGGSSILGGVLGLPLLELIEDGSSSPTTLVATAVCFGDGWAEFHFPGVGSEGVCTDPAADGCSGDNGFTIRVQCFCAASNYNGPGWYVVANGSTAFTPSVAYNLQTPPACTVKLCPGGPYATEADAIAATCFIVGGSDAGESPCLAEGLIVPKPLELEFFDGTGNATCLNGTVAAIDWNGNLTTPTWTASGGVALCGNTGWLGSLTCQSPAAGQFRLHIVWGLFPQFAVDLDPATSITNNGLDIEILFQDAAFTEGGTQTGTISVLARYRAP